MTSTPKQSASLQKKHPSLDSEAVVTMQQMYPFEGTFQCESQLIPPMIGPGGRHIRETVALISKYNERVRITCKREEGEIEVRSMSRKGVTLALAVLKLAKEKLEEKLGNSKLQQAQTAGGPASTGVSPASQVGSIHAMFPTDSDTTIDSSDVPCGIKPYPMLPHEGEEEAHEAFKQVLREFCTKFQTLEIRSAVLNNKLIDSESAKQHSWNKKESRKAAIDFAIADGILVSQPVDDSCPLFSIHLDSVMSGRQTPPPPSSPTKSAWIPTTSSSSVVEASPTIATQTSPQVTGTTPAWPAPAFTHQPAKFLPANLCLVLDTTSLLKMEPADLEQLLSRPNHVVIPALVLKELQESEKGEALAKWLSGADLHIKDRQNLHLGPALEVDPTFSEREDEKKEARVIASASFYREQPFNRQAGEQCVVVSEAVDLSDECMRNHIACFTVLSLTHWEKPQDDLVQHRGKLFADDVKRLKKIVRESLRAEFEMTSDLYWAREDQALGEQTILGIPDHIANPVKAKKEEEGENTCTYGLCMNKANSTEKYCARCTAQVSRNNGIVPQHLEALRRKCNPCPGVDSHECKSLGSPEEEDEGLCVDCSRKLMYEGKPQFIHVHGFGPRFHVELKQMLRSKNLPADPWVSEKEGTLDKYFTEWRSVANANTKVTSGDISSFREDVRLALGAFYGDYQVPSAFNCPRRLSSSVYGTEPPQFFPPTQLVDFSRRLQYLDEPVHFIRSKSGSQPQACDWLANEMLSHHHEKWIPITVSCADMTNARPGDSSIFFATALYAATFGQAMGGGSKTELGFTDFVNGYKFLPSLGSHHFEQLVDSVWRREGKRLLFIVDQVDVFLTQCFPHSDGTATRLEFAAAVETMARCSFVFSGGLDLFLDTGHVGGKSGTSVAL